LGATLGFCAPHSAGAVEYTIGLYSLGSGAVGAGQLPPAGVYFTTALAANHYQNSTIIPYGGLSLAARANVAPAFLGNILAVMPDEVLGGRFAVSMTSGFALSSVNASIANIERSVQGWGAADSIVSAALGWQVTPEFSHKITVSQWIPTGRYQTGFFPIIGLNRPGSDFSWGATYMLPANGLELSGTAGFTLEGFNDLTSYRSGDALHFEESISKHFDNGFRAGVYSTQYAQVTGDSGAGAKLGPFKTSAVGVGPSFGYITMLGGHLVSITLQGAHEVAVKNRLIQTTGILSVTYKF
jgi:hypothetical protein